MKIGVVGYGSIGKRHVMNLMSLGYRDITLFREKGKGNEFNLKEEYDSVTFSQEDFDFLVISNPTTFHYRTASPFIKTNKNLFIEKPVVFQESELDGMMELLASYTGIGMVGYNMRFHPCIKRIRQILDEGKIGDSYSSRFFVGQYLPDWRTGQDYRKGVSAHKHLGGGVVFELIHEIDMALFLFGQPVSEINSIALKSSDLVIETEDISEILYLADRNVIVSIHQDYLNRDYRRTIEIIGSKGTLFCDLKSSEIRIISSQASTVLNETIPFDRNDMYLDMIKYYTCCVKGKIMAVPDLTESLESVQIALEVRKTNKL
jgi:predicted dehydrogenase